MRRAKYETRIIKYETIYMYTLPEWIESEVCKGQIESYMSTDMRAWTRTQNFIDVMQAIASINIGSAE